jgi:hypothetical protein
MGDVRRLLLALLAVLALGIGATACGGGGDDGDDSSASEADGGSGEGGSEGSSGGSLPDPCQLVPLEAAEEAFGEPVAEPESTSTEGPLATTTCTWVTQASIDAPTLDTAGRVLVVSALGAPNETMSVEDLYEATAESADEEGEVCDRSFWVGGVLHAFQDGTYLTASAGLADAGDDARAAAETVIAAACENL